MEMGSSLGHIEGTEGYIKEGCSGVRAGDIALRGAAFADKGARALRRGSWEKTSVVRLAPGVQSPRGPDRGGALVVEVCNPASRSRWDPQTAPAGIHHLFGD